MSKPELETLRKVLSLERSKGYKDNAVVGGLDRFLALWHAKQYIWTPINLPFRDYSSITKAQRKKWVEGILKTLDGKLISKSDNDRPINEVCGIPSSGEKREDKTPPTLASNVALLPRVTPKLAGKLKRLGVNTIKDLLYLFPRRHNDLSNLRKVSQIEVDTEQTLIVNVWEAREVLLGGRYKAAEAVVGDNTGNLRVVWFNQPYLARRFKPGTCLVLSGRVASFKDKLVMESPEHEVIRNGEELIHTGRLVPLYPLTEGLTPRVLRRLVREALNAWNPLIEETLTGDILQRVRLQGLQDAVMQIHYPDNEESKTEARRRLAFDELFMMQLYVFSRRREWRESGGAVPLGRNQDTLNAFFAKLPFDFTGAQRKALGQILGDMEKDRPMSRLLQGDVGSGKTAVAIAALLETVSNHYQCAFMAPTEILAHQHFNTLSRLLESHPRPANQDHWFTFHLENISRPISIGILTGSQSSKHKREIKDMMSTGDLDIVLGTHSILQEGVEIPHLAFAVVDEQHRFGVMQRASLRNKGKAPHLLVMSATPIPRSLALTLYGDLDISILDELPPGRQVIQTKRVYPEHRTNAYQFLLGEIKKGHQVFIICPLIEESDVLQTRAATKEFNHLSTEVFPDLSIGLLHGRMPLKDKEDVMARFQNGEMDILVSTPVVEVGIDNPNATVMLIEGADRFGLAQLHQFRGRVGRGEHSSYCFLMCDYPSREAKERLEIMEREINGFAVAEEDMRFRGPGDFFGTRQSGMPDLRMARLSDQDLLVLAREEASALLKKDPYLLQTSHQVLAKAMSSFSSSPKGEKS